MGLLSRPGDALSAECRVPLIREVVHPLGIWAVSHGVKKFGVFGRGEEESEMPTRKRDGKETPFAKIYFQLI